ncbi:MAG: DNA polymerase III subunit delta [Chloroflexota bacterium]
MLHIVFGPDSFSAHECVQRLLASLSANDPDGEGVARLEGKTATPTDILNACGQVSLFGGRPVVIVEGLLARFESKKRAPRGRGRKKKGSGSGEWDGFADRLGSVVEAGDLILVDGALDAKNEMLVALRPLSKQVHVFPVLGGEELQKWIVRRVKEAGAGIEADALRQLSGQSQGDLWYLSSEIEKLAAYSQGKTITSRAIAELTTGTLTSNIFWLVDAIVEGRVRDAQRLLDEMWRSGFSAGYVLTMVERQLRIVAQALEATEARGKVRIESGEFAGLPEFARTRAVKQSRGMTQRSVESALACVVAADRSIKTGRLDERVALDLLINDLVTVGRTDRVDAARR